MSRHPSLKTVKAGKKIRTVLKRYEKFFALKEKGILKDELSVFGMPKLKILRTKIKKEKSAEKPKEGETPAVGATVSTQKEAPKKETPKKEEKGKK